MNAVQILDHLTQRGVQIWVENEQLRLRSPAGVLGEEDRQLLSRHKTQLLGLLDNRQQSRHPSKFRVTPKPEDLGKPFALTDIQQAYWIGRQEAFDLGDVAIHFYSEVDCEELDVERFTEAWNRLVERHGMLRAVVHEDGQQQILEQVPRYELPLLDLRDLDAEKQRDRLESLRDEFSHRVPSPAEWPSFDLRLTRLDEKRLRLHFSLDLLHVDGASILILCGDLTRLYQNPQVELPQIGLSYRDYALAEHAVVDLPEFQEGLKFWREKVKTLPAAPDLPLALAPSQLEKTRFVRQTLEMSSAVFERLKESAARLGLTPTAFFLTAFAETLRAYSKTPDLTLNVTLFNRLQVHPDVNRLVGDFTSMVLVGDQVQPGETLIERARRRQQELWEALEHRHVSGVKVLGELNKVHSNASGGTMPVVFTSLLDLKTQGFDPEVLTTFGEEVYTITQTPQVYLDHQVREAENGGIILSWDIVEDLFPPGLVQEMFAAYHRLLHRLVDDHDLWQQAHLRVVTDAELEQRQRLNDTAAPIPDETLYTLFVGQALARPGNTAVVSEERVLTYGELHRLTRHLGRRLRALGALPDTLVAIAMDKGWEQIVAAVAVHAAGAAYLPLDPQVPLERRNYLLEAAEVDIVLTQSWVETRLEWSDRVRCLAVDREIQEENEAGAVAELEPIQGSHHLSHVIYTSGSTGLPKGVMVEHRSVVNRMLDIIQRFDIGPGDKALALTALHHDLSVFDIFGVLAAGAAMVIPEEAQRRDPGHWLDLMASNNVTLWNSVPAFLEMLMEYTESDGAGEAVRKVPASLRWVIMAGDWIPVSLPDRLRAQVPHVEFIASGGPTETCIWDIWNPVGEVDPSWPSIPYGKPLSNARYHVFDHALEDRPVWVPGEMYIGGAGLARGYWKDADKTAEKFIEHPRTGERLYRSGDWGRYLPDGNLEFMGREDFQVKIRGQRIELGEVEAAINAHSQVRASVAMVVDDHRGRRLVAFVVPTAGTVNFTAASPASAIGDGLAASSNSDFEQAGVEVTDPLERTQFKLRYGALRRRDPANPSLALPALDQTALAERLQRGKSYRQWSRSSVRLETFGRFLSDLAFVEQGGLHKYRYGSGGGLYPVQVYLYIAPGRVESIDAGIYYFHPGDQRLERLSEAEIDPAIHYAANRSMAESAAFQLFLIGDLEAVRPMYGDLATSFCYLEAGMICQLLRESTAETGIGICQVGNIRFDEIREHFQLESRHLFLHALLGGALLEGSAATGMTEAAMAATENGSADDMLMDRRSFQQELRAFLERKLPEHMVPGGLVLLENLPLTANGKVDRKWLSEVEVEESASETRYVAPSGEVETTLAELWQETLGIEAIGVNSNFFDLGANSTLVVRVYRQLKQRLGKDFPLITMFRHPTISSLAEFLGQEGSEEPKDFSRSESRAESRRLMMKKRRRKRGRR